MNMLMTKVRLLKWELKSLVYKYDQFPIFFTHFWVGGTAKQLHTVVDRVYKKRSAEDTITNITLGCALNSWFE